MRRLVIIAERSVVVHGIQTAVRRGGEFELVGRMDAWTATAETILGTEPDVVLLDDASHSERVLELLREIRARDATVAVLVLGLDLGPEWLARAFGAGATAAISTATPPLTLVTLVRETIDGHIVHRPSATPDPDVPGGAHRLLGSRTTVKLTLAAATASRPGEVSLV